VRQFAKPFFIVTGAAAALCTLLILGINVYLQSKDVQQRVRAAASEAAGMPVEIRLISYTPWGGFAVTGITVSRAGEAKIPLLAVESVQIHLRIFQLLRGNFIIRDILLNEPSLAPAQTPSGQWSLQADSARESPPTPGAPEPAAPLEISPPAARPAVIVERVRIRQGRAVAYDSRGNPLVSLEGIDLEAKVAPDGEVSGTLQIREAVIARVIRPGRIAGSFSSAKGKWDIPEIHADWAGGRLTGTLQIQPLSDGRFQATVSADGISLAKLAGDAGMDGNGTEGELFGKAACAGMLGKPDSLVGEAGITLQGARIQPLDFIRQVGEITRISELKMLQFKTAEAAFTIKDAKIHADNLVLESENLVLDATGPTGFDGKMKLAARFHVNEKLRKDLRGFIGKNFGPSEREGYVQTPFSVTGSVSRPKTDLLEKIIGIKIGQDVGGLLKNLFSIPSEKNSGNTGKSAPPEKNGD